MSAAPAWNFRSVATCQSILSDAWTNYTDAIKVLLRNELYSSDELKDLEMELVRSRYEHRDHLLSSAHEDGRRILRRLMGYAAVGARPLSERVDALLQLADWDLLFSSNGTALEAYRQAYEQLEEGDAPRASIEQVFAPRREPQADRRTPRERAASALGLTRPGDRDGRPR